VSRTPRRPRRSTRVDPELARQIANAEKRVSGAASPEVQAVFFLDSASAASDDPKEVDARVRKLLRRVAQKSHERPAVVNVFGNLGSFVVQAPPAFLRDLIEQPEIRHARANRPANRDSRDAG
jgi:hypothetical protein